MSLSARRLRSIGWLALLAVCATLVLVLTLRVNALRSQVRHEENRIVALREETLYLQTEFETRASQQQLKAWNDVDFGYVAPAAGQYLENERQLAMLGKPAGPDAPAPVRLAELGDGTGAQTTSVSYPAMVSPLTGRPAGKAVRSDAVARGEGAERLLAAASQPEADQNRADHATAAAALGERLGSIEHGQPTPAGAHKAAAKAKAKPAGKLKAKTKAKAVTSHKPKTHSSEAPG